MDRNSYEINEALCVLGRVDDPATHEERRLLLERFLLTSKDVIVRDGAVNGLTSINDPRSKPALLLALTTETNKIQITMLGVALGGIDETNYPVIPEG